MNILHELCEVIEILYEFDMTHSAKVVNKAHTFLARIAAESFRTGSDQFVKELGSRFAVNSDPDTPQIVKDLIIEANDSMYDRETSELLNRAARVIDSISNLRDWDPFESNDWVIDSKQVQKILLEEYD